jgi:hypothetical protein
MNKKIILIGFFILFLFLFKREIKDLYYRRNLIRETKIDENLFLKVYLPFNFGVSGEITSYYIGSNKDIYLGTCDEKEFFQAKKLNSSTIEVIKYSRRNMFGKGVRVIDSVQIKLE